MKKYGIVYACICLIFLVTEGKAQELNCTVNLNFDQLIAQQKTDAQSMDQLKTYISEFVNNTRWTNEQFAPEERIKCRLNINLIRSLTQGSYEANAQLIITRPVYNATYETVLFTFVDRNFNFTFLPNNPMFFNENNYTDELPFTLAYYAYIVLTLDYDSFGKQGGNPYLQRAFNLANLARNASSFQKAWSTTGDSRNRYSLVENLMSQQFIPFREGMYTYHRLGLDVITVTPGLTRKKAMEMLTTVKQVAQLRPGAVVINSFFDAKSEELYNLFREASPDERQQAYTMLSSLDPTKTELYRKLIQ
ncbi:type IX secretion system protein PorD [Arundinibacter roseus]|uniref:DUF4835 family protein n=1 Tax=Arundinibacter roseus TaxID=2070510 RepID=A0A4R4KNQ2_9BACT|nr:DUF4835 family protein [Arundinibacter roseus]TDB68201.1 DUF4835 family protein [Arundinibacter roseus]